MKTHKHGHGMTHKQVVKFSNRLAYSANDSINKDLYSKGWNDACKYFAHQLRKELRYCESINEI